MATAILTQDIIAYDDEDNHRTFQVDLGIDVEDWDDDYFEFSNPETGQLFYCDEKPGLVLRFNDQSLNNSSDNTPATSIEQYKPVPNMTPLDKRFLLL